MKRGNITENKHKNKRHAKRRERSMAFQRKANEIRERAARNRYTYATPDARSELDEDATSDMS